MRAALGSYDRGHTAVSQLKPGDIDWDEIFGKHGARWFHTGGIFCALSATTPEVALEAMQAAKRHGTIVSYDLNYRPSFWKSIGGKKQAQEVNRRIAPLVDVMLGNEEDFSAALGYEVSGMDGHLSDFEVESFKQMIAKVVKDYPFQVVATTLRKAKTATRNDWGAICYCDGTFYQAKEREESRDLRSRRRRRLLRLRPDLRISRGQGSAVGSRMWRGPRRARHDHARRHHHGHPAGSNSQSWKTRALASRANDIPWRDGSMNKQQVRDRILEIGVIPVVRADSAAEALLAAQAVCDGGIPIVEITMTVPGAVEVIRELRKNAAASVLIGAGTVLDVEAARRCVDAGAQFLVSPGLNLPTVEFAVRERHADDGGRSHSDRSHHCMERRFGLRQSFPVRPGRRREIHQGS